MIVACERCATRFRLDEAKLPPTGSRVRCSRCKHSFFLHPPGAEEDVLADLAAQAAATAAPSPPEPTQDLPPETPEPSGETSDEETDAGPETTAAGHNPLARDTSPFETHAGETLDAPSREGQSGDDESDWEFNSEILGQQGAPAGSEARPQGDALDSLRSESEPAGRSPLDELGDPGSWDFLAPEPGAPESPKPPSPAPPIEAPPERSEAPAPEPASQAVSAPPVAMPRGRAEARAPRPVAEAPSVSRLLNGLGWLAVGGLLVLGGVRALGIAAPHAEPLALPSPIEGMKLEDVRGRHIDNVPAGSIFVVSGQFRNHERRWRGLEAMVLVQLLGADGQPLPGLRTVAGRPLPARRLREEDPATLGEHLVGGVARFARHAVAPGHAIPFEAVLEGLPWQAASLAVEAQPLPRLAPPPPAEPATGPEPGARTEASRPSLLPSSE